MLDTPQRLAGLYILYEIYRHENVKTTPFYQLMLDLLSSPIHISERKLLTELVKSVPKIAKLTPSQYLSQSVAESESVPAATIGLDLEPYRKAHAENMPAAPLKAAASVPPMIDDFNNPHEALKASAPVPIFFDQDELTFGEFVPPQIRPIPFAADESYLLENVGPCFGFCSGSGGESEKHNIPK